MKTLHLAGSDDAPKLLAMVGAFHAEHGFETTPEQRSAAIVPLLEGSPHGAIWLIGPRKAPVGYIAVSFGWSLELGGLDAIVDEVYVRSAVRGRGMGSEAIDSVAFALREAGVKALHLEAKHDDTKLHALYRRTRFTPRDGYVLMTRML